MIYIIDSTTFLELFVFDCEQQENRRTEIQWTDKPIEAGAEISDFGVEKPDAFHVEGLKTAWPLSPVPMLDPLRVIDADASLRALAKAKQPVTLVTGWWVEEVVLRVVDASQAAGDGDLLRFALDCKTIKVPQPATVQIPPSRLQPKVQKRGAPKPKGGAETGKTPKPDNRTLALKLVEKMGITVPTR